MTAAMPARGWTESLRPRDDRMTGRGRAYLLILGLRHLAAGVIAIATPEQFTTPAFRAVRGLLPLVVWACMFVALGAQGVVIAVSGRELHARLVLVMSATLTGMWAAGFVLAGFRGDAIPPIMPVIWTALVAKDLVVAGMPLRPPIIELGRGAH